jgi:hypothetical protein
MENIIHNPSMECMSRDERASLQGIRLRQTIKREYDNVPLYRERMKAAGIKPEDIKSIEDIRYLPFTEKNDLRDQYPFGLLAAPSGKSSGFTATRAQRNPSCRYKQNDLDFGRNGRAMPGGGRLRSDDVCRFAMARTLHRRLAAPGRDHSRDGHSHFERYTQRQIMMMQDYRHTILS